MKKLIVGIGMMFLGLSGCATEGTGSVQTDTFTDRFYKLEAKVNALEATGGKQAVLSDADKAMIKEANDKAQKALDATNSLSVELTKANEAAKKADMAAHNADMAAQNAKKAEEKSEKLFNLEQKK